VRANTNAHKKLWFDGSGLVSCVFRRELCGIALGFWVSQLPLYILQSFELLRCAPDDPNRFATPLNCEFFAWFDCGDIDLNRCASRFGSLGGAERTDKRDCDRSAANCTNTTRRD
jgi:hypothetical protein